MLAVLATGGGKSICYQVPGIYRGGLCLVISPLIALMKDQIEGLRRKGIRCDIVTSERGPRDAERALENAAIGVLQFLYVSPERLQSVEFLDRLHRMPIRTIAVDEAHCISQWGHDFRPAYRWIGKLRDLKPEAAWGAFTGTATPLVIRDIVLQLALNEPKIHRSKMRRPNLHFGVVRSRDAQAGLIHAAMQAEGTGLVYVGSRMDAERWADRLKRAGLKAEAFHAGMPADLKALHQLRWIKGEIQVLACTSAFGMGIDKPDVRWVYHAHIPFDLESYVQEAGRAGRDGLDSQCILFLDERLLASTEEQLMQRFPDPVEVGKVYQGIANQGQVAIGDLPEAPTRFNADEWAKQKGLKQQVVRASIQLLNQTNWLRIEEIAGPSEGHWILIATEHQAQKWIQEQQFGWELLDALRRKPNARNGIPFHPNQWAASWHIPLNEVMLWLEKWDRMGIAEWRTARPGLQIHWLEPRMDMRRWNLPAHIFQERKDHLLSKWRSVVAYISSEDCKASMLESYFTESKNTSDCGICCNCLAKTWDFESWLLANVPIGGITPEKLVTCIPLLVHDHAIRRLSQSKAEGSISVHDGKVLITK